MSDAPLIFFEKTLDLSAPVARLWAFHERPDAFALLQPPWERAEILELPSSLEVGARARVRVYLGPIPMIIEAEHVAYEPGHLFVDEMRRGPFATWRHEHRCEPTPTGSRLIDAITYRLPLGRLGQLVGDAAVRRRLERLFDYRHQVTKRYVEAQGPLA
jgi:ligand-binding SRPBCC domain-containing protein